MDLKICMVGLDTPAKCSHQIVIGMDDGGRTALCDNMKDPEEWTAENHISCKCGQPVTIKYGQDTRWTEAVKDV